MRRFWFYRPTVLSACVVLTLAACSAAPETEAQAEATTRSVGPETEDATPGPAIGAQAPDFALKDQDGKTRTLDEFLDAGKTVALVFYRSADW